MSQSNVGDLKDTQSKGAPTPKIEDEFPLFTIIMVVIGLIAASVAFVKFIIATMTYGY